MALAIERALAPLFPAWALRRAQARMAADLTFRAYDAAKPSRATKNWRTSGASAAAEDSPALAALRNRSRDLCRNNPWGRRARRKLPADMVGTGVTPRATSHAKVTRQRAMSAWNRWADQTDVENGIGDGGQQHLIAGSLVESGEVFRLWNPDARAAAGWTTRVLEADFLDETHHEASRNGSGRIVAGVEFDSSGRRAAYHFWRDHPGDVAFAPGLRRDKVRVEARFVDHVFEVVRPGQVRGVPWMAASALGMRDLGDYMEAERWRKKITAALAAFVTSPAGPSASSLGAVRTDTQPDGKSRAIETIAPGTIKRLQPGESVTFSTPPGDGGADAHIRWQLLAICAGIGAPYADVTGDLSNANYGSMRVGRVEYWGLLDAWQWHMLAPMLLKPAWARVQATGGVPGMECAWAFPRRAWIDPLKDAQAEDLSVRSLRKSPQDAIAERGDDWREVLEETAEFREYCAELGLPIPGDAAAPAVNPDDTEPKEPDA